MSGSISEIGSSITRGIVVAVGSGGGVTDSGAGVSGEDDVGIGVVATGVGVDAIGVGVLSVGVGVAATGIGVAAIGVAVGSIGVEVDKIVVVATVGTTVVAIGVGVKAICALAKVASERERVQRKKVREANILERDLRAGYAIVVMLRMWCSGLAMRCWAAYLGIEGVLSTRRSLKNSGRKELKES